MNRRFVALVAAGVVAYAAFVVAGAPATLVAGAVAEHDRRLRIESVSGTVWHGHGRSLSWHGHEVGAVEWRIGALDLLRGVFAARVDLAGRGMAARARVHHRPLSGRTEISEAHARANLSELARLGGARGPVTAQVEVTGLALTLDQGRPAALSGSVLLRDVAVFADRTRQLGDYRLALGVDSGWLHAEVAEATGPLEVFGGVRFAFDGRWELDARLRAADGAADVASVLELLGEPDATGHRRIALSGSL